MGRRPSRKAWEIASICKAWKGTGVRYVRGLTSTVRFGCEGWENTGFKNRILILA